jgi:hypothetical protein
MTNTEIILRYLTVKGHEDGGGNGDVVLAIFPNS